MTRFVEDIERTVRRLSHRAGVEGAELPLAADTPVSVMGLRMLEALTLRDEDVEHIPSMALLPESSGETPPGLQLDDDRAIAAAVAAAKAAGGAG